MLAAAHMYASARRRALCNSLSHVGEGELGVVSRVLGGVDIVVRVLKSALDSGPISTARLSLDLPKDLRKRRLVSCLAEAGVVRARVPTLGLDGADIDCTAISA